ncbi:3-isopropylmalate/(R)-2-methylmalate dehydratase small subunit [Sulfitobacter brevis]|uniref:3-isopropylmalate/(R)-2-methylmalate dehydratase small subunit n=1 Tax=Sulfitobacter brevis TaxID=74348 RepID=A0A1I2BVL1_9RHOB|nr:3-isopropylmalate dehydratase [Sulfitobacter brevis]SFE60111.1 3-isopropylmalate/(R)-2-methylmalate dehydratase small subunit [Sulfitobacter brevis]
MPLNNLRGRVAFIFDEVDFDVDQIVGVENIKLKDPAELAAVAMSAYDPEFAKAVRTGDILIGADNFGYGHPHYPPMIAMRHLGIAGVVAESFSPGYWRGEIAMGFPQAACPGVRQHVSRWDEVEVDWTALEFRNLTTGIVLPIETLAEGDRLMLAEGGLIGYLHAREKEISA